MSLRAYTPGQLIRLMPSVGGGSAIEVYYTHRRSGGRIKIVAHTGVVLYDSQDCYDLANAVAGAEKWASQHVDQLTALDAAASGECPPCWH